MQDHIVVGRIAVMMMMVPVGRPDMYLDIPGPFLAADAQPRAQKVGAGVIVVTPGVTDLHILAAHSMESAAHHPLFPQILV